MSPQNSALKRAFWLVPFRLQEMRIVFSTEKFAKNFISGVKMEIGFGKEEKVSKNPFQWAFLRKAIVLNGIYAEIVV